ncbi:MAG: hypothetical protein JWN89_605 [Parcubacteria group bacterium]|nr:hypothetical protein [Parcubacteria group bacterium]
MGDAVPLTPMADEQEGVFLEAHDREPCTRQMLVDLHCRPAGRLRYARRDGGHFLRCGDPSHLFASQERFVHADGSQTSESHRHEREEDRKDPPGDGRGQRYRSPDEEDCGHKIYCAPSCSRRQNEESCVSEELVLEFLDLFGREYCYLQMHECAC